MARLSSAIIRYNKYRGCVHSHHARPRVLHTIGQFPPVSCHSLPLPMDPISKEISGASSTKLQLYSYWQSSCSWRVRFALNLKGLSYEYKAVDLSKGEQFSPEFERLNPICFVPVLVDGDLVVSDSFAILLYLDEKYPQNALLPVDIKRRAVNLQAASIISSSIQPLQMQSVLKYIEEKLSPEDRLLWAQHYILKGFTALEELLKDFVGKYATGDEVYMADVFLAPQINVASARFNIDMSRFPTLNRINEAYKVLPAFQASLPERQPDAKIL
ncbi:glutathione S-transferase 2-like isoform X1 [Magnolia sinica]|uniref:glutathione S-transferase 2-like isoform X1 n=1 Tax=Magnolia sinica TaxID=86752 RepID=UPI00265A4073|nr:glutathione S-transferase 2-like isoform X1 [Magnolia sinica]